MTDDRSTALLKSKKLSTTSAASSSSNDVTEQHFHASTHSKDEQYGIVSTPLSSNGGGSGRKSNHNGITKNYHTQAVFARDRSLSGSWIRSSGGGSAMESTVVSRSSKEKVPTLEELPVLFADASMGPSANLLCPLHRGLFVEPVIARCGHTFCRACLERYVRAECPLDKVVIKLDDVASAIPNLVLVDTIASLRIHCRYGCDKVNGTWQLDMTGCKEMVAWSKRAEHENTCNYATVRCPNNPTKCPTIRRMELTEHLERCAHFPCPHQKLGCSFDGPKTQVDQHVVSCVFETTKAVIDYTDRRYNKLKTYLLEKEHENKELRTIIAQLSERMATLLETMDTKTSKRTNENSAETREKKADLFFHVNPQQIVWRNQCVN
jgi:hypothetical protein